MAGEVKNLLIGFTIFGLFVTLLTTVIYNMGLNYGVDSVSMEQVTGGALDMEDYEEELEDIDDTSQNYRQRFESGTINDVDDADGIFSILGDVWGIITTPVRILSTVGQNLLGIPASVINTILAIINILIILGVWSVLRSGS